MEIFSNNYYYVSIPLSNWFLVFTTFKKIKILVFPKTRSQIQFSTCKIIIGVIRMRTKIIGIILSLTLLFNSTVLMAFSYPVKSDKKTYQSIVLANKYAKIAHDAYDKKQFLKAAQYYEKAYKVSNYKLYQDNQVVAFTSYVYTLSASKDYPNAVDYGNKLLLMRPNDQNIKELMAEVYYSRGVDYFYTGNLDKAKEDLENSLKFSINKEQTDRAQDGLSKN